MRSPRMSKVRSQRWGENVTSKKYKDPSKSPLEYYHQTTPSIQPISQALSREQTSLSFTNMRSILLGLIALVATVSANPVAGKSTPPPPPSNPCGITGACPTVGEMKCCGSGFITCDDSGWVYRACGPGTACLQLPSPGPLYCGYAP
jgi:hypothetical protein